MQVDLLNKEGENVGQVELHDSIFGVQPNENVMHQAVVAYLANRRQGTHNTKIRSEVRGGGRKPWRQKGRGTARAGSIRSPIWAGGGTIHGPKPHKHTVNLSKKVRRLARNSAFSLRVTESNLTVVDDFELDEIKTKNMAQILKNLKLESEKILVLLPEPNEKILFSLRNIPKVSVRLVDQTNTYEILSHKKVLMFKGAVEYLNNINN